MEKYQLKDQDYLDLWKYYSEDTAKIKDKLWTIASWLYALMSGLLGFVVKYSLESNADIFFTIATTAAGMGLSYYTYIMIQEYGKHVRNGWKVVRKIQDKFEGFGDLWKDNNKDEVPFPAFATRLMILALGYGLGFFLALVYAVFKSTI